MKVTVLGDGGWGTALAMVLDRNGHEVTVWGPFESYVDEMRIFKENITYLPGVKLPDSISWTSSHANAVDEAELIVIVVPSRYYRQTLEDFKAYIPENALIISATKGLDEKTYERMSEVAEKILGHDVAVLSGPSHAEKVARKVPYATSSA